MNAHTIFIADAAAANQTATPATTVTEAKTAASTEVQETKPGEGAAAQPQPGFMDGLMGMLPFIVIIVVMFYLMYRGQKKEQKRRQEMIESVKKGDPVLTVGGIFGEVVEVKEKAFVIKIADNVSVTVAKSAVSTVDKSGEVAKK